MPFVYTWIYLSASGRGLLLVHLGVETGCVLALDQNSLNIDMDLMTVLKRWAEVNCFCKGNLLHLFALQILVVVYGR